MRVVVSANGPGLDAEASPIFGRCPYYVFIDTETEAVESTANPAQNTAGGAGIRAAQFVAEQGAKVALTGNVGPNANGVLQAAGISIYLVRDVTVGQAYQAYASGELQQTTDASVAAHVGMGRRATTPSGSRDAEIKALYGEALELRKKLAEIVTRIEKLDKE